MKLVNLKYLGAIAIACLAITSTASAQVIYQDSFSYTGNLTGTKPDVSDTNNNVWAAGDSAGGWSASGGTATGNNFYGGEFLPVNGTSGVTLDGTLNFTLSVDVAQVSGGNGIGIVLGTNNHDTGGYFTASTDSAPFLAQLGLASGNNVLSASGSTQLANTAVGASTGNLTLSYNASAGSIAYIYNGTTEYTLSVTQAQIAALTTVGVGLGAFVKPASVDNFTLTVASAPEPSTYALMLAGVGALFVFARRRVA